MPPKDRRRASDMEVDGPFGTKIRFYGRQVSSVLLIFVLAYGLWYFMNQHDVRAAEMNKAAMEAMAKIQANQMALAEHMDEMIYVLKLSEKERERLDIAMPDSLRRKLR